MVRASPALEYARPRDWPNARCCWLTARQSHVGQSRLCADRRSRSAASIVALVGALTALVQIASKDNAASVDRHMDTFKQAYQFLTQPETAPPPDLMDEEIRS